MKRSFLIILALTVAIPTALAAGGTRIVLKPAKPFPAAQGTAQYKAKAGEREFEIEVEHLRRLAGRQVMIVVAGTKLGTAKVSGRGSAATPSSGSASRRSRQAPSSRYERLAAPRSSPARSSHSLRGRPAGRDGRPQASLHLTRPAYMALSRV